MQYLTIQLNEVDFGKLVKHAQRNATNTKAFASAVLVAWLANKGAPDAQDIAATRRRSDATVLQQLTSEGASTVVELVRATGLSSATVAQALARLLGGNEITRGFGSSGGNGVGRPAYVYAAGTAPKATTPAPTTEAVVGWSDLTGPPAVLGNPPKAPHAYDPADPYGVNDPKLAAELAELEAEGYESGEE